jgi:hypothetical protein
MGTRVESGFAQRFIRLLDDNVTTKEADIISKWPGLNWVKENKAVHLLLFLIEDLVFHACEKNNPMFYSNTDLHKARIREFEKIVEHVENKQIKMTCF